MDAATITILVEVACGVVILWGINHLQKSAKRAKKQQDRLHKTVDAFQKSVLILSEAIKPLEGIGKTLDSLPGYMSGLVKVSEAHVHEVAKMRVQVVKFSSLITRQDGEVASLEVPTEEQKDFTTRAMELQSSNPGMTMADALKRVIDAEAGQDTNSFFSLQE